MPYLLRAQEKTHRNSSSSSLSAHTYWPTCLLLDRPLSSILEHPHPPATGDYLLQIIDPAGRWSSNTASASVRPRKTFLTHRLSVLRPTRLPLRLANCESYTYRQWMDSLLIYFVNKRSTFPLLLWLFSGKTARLRATVAARLLIVFEWRKRFSIRWLDRFARCFSFPMNPGESVKEVSFWCSPSVDVGRWGCMTLTSLVGPCSAIQR